MARTVLFADDSPTIQKRASGILTGEGLEVVTVSNGIAAIKKLPTVKPLLVLADVSMPGKDGYEVCEYVKNSPDLLHVPVLLVVNADEPYDEQRGAHVRADGTITKPFNRDELISTVAKFLAQVEAAASLPAATEAAVPEPAAVTPPVNEELQFHSQSLDLASFSQGVAFAEPTVEEAPEGAPEPTTRAETTFEFPPSVERSTGTANPAPAFEPPTVEPVFPRDAVLTEDPAVVRPAPPQDFGEGPVAFPPSSNIGEPPQIEEPGPALPATEPSPVEVESDRAPVAHSLESFTLADSTAHQAEFASPEAQAFPAPVPAPPEACGEAVVTTDRTAAPGETLIRSIIHQVVAKMSPPAFPPDIIEQIARKFSDEIIADIAADPRQKQ